MNSSIVPSMRRAASWTAMFVTCAVLQAADTRTWKSVDGKSLEGVFDKIEGDNVIIKTSDGRAVSVPKTRLSQGDLQYVKDVGGNVPESKPSIFADNAPKNNKVPIPAKEAKVDRKAFVKKKDLFYVAQVLFNTVETPHFYINYLGNVGDPDDLGECAERLWQEMAFYHPDFAAKWGDKRMAVFFTEKDADYNNLGKWYRDMLAKSNPDSDEVRKAISEMATVWPQTSAAAIMMDAETADKYKTHPSAPTLHIKDPKQNNGGVWSPFRTHFLSEALLEFEAGATQSFASKGRFALFTGYAYFKEIQLCGESRTSLISAKYEDGGATKTAGGFTNSKDWSGELKKILRGGAYVTKSPVKGGKDTKTPIEQIIALDRIFALERNTSNPVDIALIYALIEFMHSTQDRVTGFSKLIDTIDKARQIPDLADIVKLFGFPTAEEFQKAWLEWMKSPQFK